ncbi:MAG: indolepyruvate oxidoreductase subunit beta [Candidatus Eisenbacteria sp.]|nr:indolepyruvate oxidoreductase subunit beta [Candidatus Eisenbacteria bacterium]
MLSGVGGQGIILAGNLVADLALDAGFDVKKSEVHGMAQRGGSVVSHVRFARKVYSPVIVEGQATHLVAFELMEALRWIHMLVPGGTLIVNEQEIIPSGLTTYPKAIREGITSRCSQTVFINGGRLAAEAGNVRAVNVALLGALSKYLDFDVSEWEHAIRKRVPEKWMDVNLKAFEMGRVG